MPDWDANYSSGDDVLEVRGGRGWSRTERLFLNFRVAFEFKATTPDADPGVFVRAWVSPQRSGDWRVWGYRIRLRIRRPAAWQPSSSDTDESHRFSGRANCSSAERRVAAGQITGAGARVSLMLNGTLVGVFELEDFGGYISSTTRKVACSSEISGFQHRG